MTDNMLTPDADALAERANGEALLKEAEGTIAHLRNAKNCYYDCVDKAEANQRIANAENAALDIVRPMVEKAEADYDAALEEIVKLEQKIRAGKLVYEVATEMRKKAEADAGRLRAACQNLVDAVARAREADDAVSCEPEDENFHEQEDAHVSLTIFENAAIAALSHAEQDDGEKKK